MVVSDADATAAGSSTSARRKVTPGPETLDAAPAPTQRLVYLDNLKIVFVAGVILAHAAITYGTPGSWPYVEPKLSSAAMVILGLILAIGAIFAMGLFFLLAGLVLPAAVDRKGPGAFLRGRATRLGIPLLAFGLVVMPAVNFVSLLARTGSAGDAARFAIGQIRLPDWGPLWFLADLLLFSASYVAWLQIRRVPPANVRPIGPLRLAVLMGAIAGMSFAVRLIWPLGSWQFPNLHLWEWPQYVAMFTLGIVASRMGWLVKVPAETQRFAGIAAALGALAIASLLLFDERELDLFGGGLHWQAGAVALIEGVLSVGASVWLLARFQWSRVRAHPHLAAAAYGAFVAQTPVLVATGLLLRPLGWSGELKFVVLALVGVTVSFGLAMLWAPKMGGRPSFLGSNQH
jgi:glucan biosynthesis protein C